MTEKLKARLANSPRNSEEAEEQLRRNRLQRLGGEKCENYSAEEVEAILRLYRGQIPPDLETLGLNIESTGVKARVAS